MSIGNRLDPNTTNIQTITEMKYRHLILNSPGKEKQDPELPKSQIPNLLQISHLDFYNSLLLYLIKGHSLDTKCST